MFLKKHRGVFMTKKITKKERKEDLIDLRTLQLMASKATHLAVKHAEAAGGYITYIEDGRILKRNAENDTIVEIKSAEAKPKLRLKDLLCQA